MDENPLILYSDHKRMLAQCQERYDAQLQARFWRGAAFGAVSILWPAGFAVLFAALAGFNFGLSFVQ